MQFIFGSDKNNGYGVLCADDNAEASKVRDLIKIQIRPDIDAYGFMTFGANSNQPIFFKIKKDVSYNREAYYIHGIYQKAEDGYYQSKRFTDDMFAKFVEQDWLDALRSGQNVSLSPAVDMALANNINSAINANVNAITEALAHIYNGESIILVVNDELYSNDYARILMYRLFNYMPPALKKSCSFITEVYDAENFRVRILPASMARNANGIKILVNDPAYQGNVVPEFTEIVNQLLALARENRGTDLTKFFDEYHSFRNGFGSNYKPRQFVEFFNAYFKKDAVLTEKLLDEYLSLTDDPDKLKLPAFVIENLAGKYTDFKPFTLNSVEEMIDPQTILKKNALSLKKLYVMAENEPHHAINAVYVEFLKTQKFDDQFINRVRNSLVDTPIENLQQYKQCFYAAVNKFFVQVKGAISKVDELKARAVSEVAGGAAKFPQDNISGDNIARAKEALNNCCTAVIKEALQLGYNLEPMVSAEIDRCIAEHNRKHPPKVEQQPVALPSMVAAANMATLSHYFDGLDTLSQPDLARLLDEVCNNLSSERSFIKHCVKAFILHSKRFENNAQGGYNATRAKSIVTLTANDAKLTDEIIGDIAKNDICLAFEFIADYVDINRVFEVLLANINVYGQNFNSVGQDAAVKCINRVSRSIGHRLGANNAIDSARIDSAINNPNNKSIEALNGTNCRQLYSVISKNWINYSQGKNEEVVVSSAKMPPAVIAGIVAVAVIFGGVFFAFKSGLFGGKGDDTDKAAGTDSDSVAVSDTVSDSTDSTSDTDADIFIPQHNLPGIGGDETDSETGDTDGTSDSTAEEPEDQTPSKDEAKDSKDSAAAEGTSDSPEADEEKSPEA